ncbi:hypothetical protein AXE82_02535 [Moraxella osloensis]|nr:hypothetical protein AXE82_02535 [Moraxella osloensis]
MSVVTLIENTQQAKALKLTALSKWISKMNRQNYQLSLITNIVLIALKHCNRVCKTYFFHYKNSDKTYCQTYQNF